MWVVVAVVGWTLAIPDGWVRTNRLEEAMGLRQKAQELQQQYPEAHEVEISAYGPTDATASSSMGVVTMTLDVPSSGRRAFMQGFMKGVSERHVMAAPSGWSTTTRRDGPQYILHSVATFGTGAQTADLDENVRVVMTKSGPMYAMIVVCSGRPAKVHVCNATFDNASIAITDTVDPDDERIPYEVIGGSTAVLALIGFAVWLVRRNKPQPLPPPPQRYQAAAPPPKRQRQRVDVRFAVASAEITPGGIDARRDDGRTVLVHWAEVVAVVARRLPHAYDGHAFVDVVSGPGATLRLLPTTRFTGFTPPQDDTELARRLVALVKSQRPDVKIDKATGEFIDGQPLGQFPDAELFASYDARVP